MCAFYFFWLSASHDLRLGMDGMLLALCDHGFERSGLCAVNNNNNNNKPVEVIFKTEEALLSSCSALINLSLITSEISLVFTLKVLSQPLQPFSRMK